MYEKDVARTFRAICLETERFFGELCARPGVAGSGLDDTIRRRGHWVFAGPPPKEPPPILFVGYQPGGETGGGEGSQATECWPETNQYSDPGEDFALAHELRAIFPEETHPGFLRSCLGTNAIFLRAPNKGTYTQEVPGNVRAEIERFCVERVRRIVAAARPRAVVAIGLGTLELVEKTPTESETEPSKAQPQALRANNHWLIGRGAIMGYPAHSVLHLTGGWGMTEKERDAIAAYLRGLVAGPARA